MKKILIVDDDPDIVEAMRMVLEAQNFEAHSAINGTDGLKKVKAVNPDLIILDVMMDQLTEGFQVTYSLKKTEPGSEYAPYAKIPILMLSETTYFLQQLLQKSRSTVPAVALRRMLPELPAELQISLREILRETR